MLVEVHVLVEEDHVLVCGFALELIDGGPHALRDSVRSSETEDERSLLVRKLIPLHAVRLYLLEEAGRKKKVERSIGTEVWLFAEDVHPVVKVVEGAPLPDLELVALVLYIS